MSKRQWAALQPASPCATSRAHGRRLSDADSVDYAGCERCVLLIERRLAVQRFLAASVDMPKDQRSRGFQEAKESSLLHMSDGKRIFRPGGEELVAIAEEHSSHGLSRSAVCDAED